MLLSFVIITFLSACTSEEEVEAVSYTHLTLPTIVDV